VTVEVEEHLISRELWKRSVSTAFLLVFLQVVAQKVHKIGFFGRCVPKWGMATGFQATAGGTPNKSIRARRIGVHAIIEEGETSN
jgi:hypothetical protein